MRLSRCLLLVLVVLAPVRAFAGPKAKAEAQQHIARASQDHDEGKYADALNELNIAYTLDPRPELLYAIGQIHVKLGQCPQAITFYQRFLATHPGPGPAGAAAEAIEVCKRRGTHPEPTGPQVVPPPAPSVRSSSSVSPQPLPPAPPPVEGPHPFYYDVIGDVLVGGGVVAGVLGVIEYRNALHDLDLADGAASYDGHAAFVHDAETARAYSLVLGGSAAALIGFGVWRYVRHVRASRDRGVGVVPATGGAVVTWRSPF